jgi:hypothetical protein
MTNDQEPAKTPAEIEAAQDHAAPPEEPWLVTVEHEIEEIATTPPSVLYLRVLKLDLPYIIMLSLAVLGIAYDTFSGEMATLYWLIVVPVYAGICVYAGWRHAETQSERNKLIWTQALHWVAVFVAMWLIYLPPIRDVVNNNATGLNLMTVLALATFLAGVHAEAWQICVVGLILAITVPAMAFIQQSALFTLILVLGVLFVIGTLWLTTHMEKRKTANGG